jgi:eukaryotic-like serine/threonine-protein kinase
MPRTRGMATVYLAHDLKHDRDVAIKVLHEDLGVTLGPERFLAEIKTAARLQHPHILPLLDSGEANGLLFYVMPFVAGETLRERLTRDTQLSIRDAVRVAREIADALAAAHALGNHPKPSSVQHVGYECSAPPSVVASRSLT